MNHLQETICCESNGHVTDDVRWHQKVKVVTLKYSRIRNVGISVTVQDRRMIIIDHLYIPIASPRSNWLFAV